MFHLFIDTTYNQPDITAPGMDILAACSPIAPPTPHASDTRSLMYNVISGTSMATPHASAAAAYVKAAHPDWSPAAIKSALMTTSFDVDPRKHPDLEFSYGAGHINPTRAIKQGLIFAADEEDYVKFLCKHNIDNLRQITGDNSTCKGITPGIGWDLNYPTMALYPWFAVSAESYLERKGSVRYRFPNRGYHHIRDDSL
ncbi:subtilisin-like protease SBT4.3 [Coffea arabica]|uniref:Subtilisin-like protease SBT4.3 n=1 Tax=Coffea arabica TaxID=13443 RepID=A0ABM4VIP3_COFAR